MEYTNVLGHNKNFNKVSFFSVTGISIFEFGPFHYIYCCIMRQFNVKLVTRSPSKNVMSKRSLTDVDVT